MHAETGNAITVRFALPAPELRPYITTYYRIETLCSPSQPWVEDHLHPEWANLRFTAHGSPRAALGSDPMGTLPRFCVTGATSRAARFRLGSGKSWGIGLMPLGWATLVGRNADDYADRITDGLADDAFAPFAPLAKALMNSEDDFEAELAVIEGHLAHIDKTPPRGLDTITALNSALVDPEIASVTQLAKRADLTVRSLERLSHRIFGFAPKLLLRRQRFLRSLAQFMLDPSMKWLSTLDFQYHDQAHFVRDFKQFMGMNPSAYASLDKPLLIAAARARMEIAGQAVQGLHAPHRDT